MRGRALHQSNRPNFLLSEFSLTGIVIYTFQKEKGEELPSTFTHSQACRHLLAEMSTARLIADEIYPSSWFVFNYKFIDVIYSKFEVIDFGVISNWQSFDINPCIKYRAMNLKGSQDKDKETKENKDYKIDRES